VGQTRYRNFCQHATRDLGAISKCIDRAARQSEHDLEKVTESGVAEADRGSLSRFLPTPIVSAMSAIDVDDERHAWYQDAARLGPKQADAETRLDRWHLPINQN
jgi:hypothetical protein